MQVVDLHFLHHLSFIESREDIFSFSLIIFCLSLIYCCYGYKYCPLWNKLHASSNEESPPQCCIERFLARSSKCARRREKRQNNDTSCEWECPFGTSFVKLHLPPPLPLHRRRKRCPNRGNTSAEEADAPNHEETSSTDSQNNTTQSQDTHSIQDSPIGITKRIHSTLSSITRSQRDTTNNNPR